MKQHRILIATDVPFWRKSTGAQTRINALVDYLTAESFVVRTFYLGQTGSDRYTEKDRLQIADQRLDVEQQSSDQMPKSWPGRIGWYANQFRPKLVNSSGENEADNSCQQLPRSLCLEDFRWPWAAKAFCESIASFQPESILIEYVKLSYLIDGLTSQQRNSIHCVVDTHDALHVRCQKFKQRGFKHWIEISREEEARELNKFDTVVAIQPQEAKLFQQMAPHAKTIVCGYMPQVATLPQLQPHSNESLSIGYLGSTNDSNAQAIENFLDNVWQPLKQKISKEPSTGQPPIRLVIGGSICQFVEQLIAQKKSAYADVDITLLGHVEDIADFYNAVDVVINPVEFGTGLKIKSVEGLAFGKPLLSTPEGVVGVELNDAIIVCQTADHFLSELEELARDRSRLNSLKHAAATISKSGFSNRQAYDPLKRLLLQGK